MRGARLCVLLTALSLVADDRWTLYRASIAAAESALRLNEASAARHWLQTAPPEHRGWEWRYLHSFSNRSLKSISAHDAPISGLDINMEGTLLATSSGDKALRLWDANSGAPRGILSGHASAVWSPRFRPGSPDELASIGSDGTLRVWSASNAAELRRYEKLGQGIGALAWSSDGKYLASGTWSFVPQRGVVGWLHVWDYPKNELLWKSEFGVKPITSVAFHPSTAEFIVGTWDGWAGLFPIEGNGKPRAEIRLPMGPIAYAAIQHVAFHPDGNSFQVAAKDNLVRTYDSQSGKLLREFSGHTGWANVSLAAGTWIASGSSDESVRLWDSDSASLITTLHGHSASVNALAISRDKSRIYSADASGKIYWWDTSLADNSRSVWRLPGDVYGLAFSPNGARAVTASWGGSVVLRDASAKVVWSKKLHDSSANAVAFSPDGKRLVTGGNDGRLRFIDAASGEILATWEEAPKGRAACIAFSPDGAFVFSPSSRPTGKLWSIGDAQVKQTITGGSGEIYSAAFSPDSRWLLIGWTGGELALLNLESFQLTKLDPSPGGVYAVAFHPHANQFATAGADRRIRIWEMKSLKVVRILEGHTELIYSLDYSPDASRLASASTDQSVRLWDTRTGDAMIRFPFNTQVYAVRFAPDGAKLAIAPMDSRVVILDAQAAAGAAPNR